MAEVIGWIVWWNGLRPLLDAGKVKLFTEHGAAVAARRMLDTVAAVTQERYNELNGRDWRSAKDAHI